MEMRSDARRLENIMVPSMRAVECRKCITTSYFAYIVNDTPYVSKDLIS